VELGGEDSVTGTIIPGENDAGLGNRFLQKLEHYFVATVGLLILGCVLICVVAIKKTKEKLRRTRWRLKNWQPFCWL
jgi:hypothetical protein